MRTRRRGISANRCADRVPATGRNLTLAAGRSGPDRLIIFPEPYPPAGKRRSIPQMQISLYLCPPLRSFPKEGLPPKE